MPYHCLAYSSTIAGGTNVDTTPLPDPVLPISNAHYFPNVDMNFYGGAFFGSALTRVTLTTPKSRTIVPPVLVPLNGSMNTGDRVHIVDRRNNPFRLNMVEEVSLLINNSGATSASNVLVMFWGTSLDQVPAGDIYSIHGLSTTPAVPGQWTQLNMGWDQTLPQGTYTVIGSQHLGATAIAHRFFFRPQLFRPGFVSVQSGSNITEPSYYFGGWGVLGSFNTYTWPVVEVLCGSNDVAHDVVMNMIKTA